MAGRVYAAVGGNAGSAASCAAGCVVRRLERCRTSAGGAMLCWGWSWSWGREQAAVPPHLGLNDAVDGPGRGEEAARDVLESWVRGRQYGVVTSVSGAQQQRTTVVDVARAHLPGRLQGTIARHAVEQARTVRQSPQITGPGAIQPRGRPARTLHGARWHRRGTGLAKLRCVCEP